MTVLGRDRGRGGPKSYLSHGRWAGMTPTTPGLHHVTAIASDPTTNAAFFVETLGLRLVKRTVNHDDPGTYHLYYADGAGTPGTAMTYFPWATGGQAGAFGAGQTRRTGFLIPEGSLDYWANRLNEADVDVERVDRFGKSRLHFTDPDEIPLALVASPDADRSDAEPWAESPVPEANQLRGFHGVTLALGERGPTAAVLMDVLGYTLDERTDDIDRYRSDAGGAGSVVDLGPVTAGRGQIGVGTVHHVAFEAADVAELGEWRTTLEAHGLAPTKVIDRTYFHSVYVREPGGVLFEFATRGPGFTADEEPAALGSSLVLPPQLQAQREDIASRLPPFDPPAVGTADR
jgi:glyoxalase family protein